MNNISTFTFPVVSFRSLPVAGNSERHKDYFAIVDTKNLPDLNDWRQINVRDPKLTGAVPKKIAAGFMDNPDLFVFMNRGLVIAAEDVTYDNKTGMVTLSFKDKHLHGLLDGGHSYRIISENTSAELEPPRYVKVEFLTGFDHDDITNVVDARNTSNQVKDQSLFELQNKFEDLKNTLVSQRYYDNIAWKEYETDKKTDKPKTIDVRDIISIMMCFDISNFSSSKHPINAYRSKVKR